MAVTPNKQRVITRLLNSFKKTSPAREGVFEEFVFGLCREAATPEQAATAFENLQRLFFDWNEIRVSSTREVEDALGDLSDTETRAQRIISFLQEIFEEEFAFDLEHLHKEGLKQGAKKLARYQAANEFVCAWVVQRSLGGHALPLDEPTLRTARRLALIDADREDTESARTALEHLVPKAKGVAFTDAISALAATKCHEESPNCRDCPMKSECAYAKDAKSSSRANKVKT